MKTLEKFLQTKPSYTQCSVSRLCDATGLAESTVKRFKNSQKFKVMARTYKKNIR